MEQVKDVLQHARTGVNTFLDAYEPWQVAVFSVVLFVVLRWVYENVFVEGRVVPRLLRWVFQLARKIPFVRARIQQEIAKSDETMQHSMFKHMTADVAYSLPQKPTPTDQIIRKLQATKDLGDPDKRLKEGKVSGTIYVGGHDGTEYTTLLSKAYEMFAWTNPLHPGVFPGVRQMEAEIVRMCCTLFSGDADSCGSVTSGGTESILMACKTYRDWAASRGVTRPNLVTPTTAHPAFDKAAQYLQITIRKVAVDPKTKQADVAAMRRATDSNTIALVGSCPQYPHGCVDPIAELGEIAQSRGIGLHVDCCLGSFLVPFMRKAGFVFPDFDFSVPGVTSISADTHKFGFAPKGSSVVLYRNKEIMQHQYSVFPDWPGGIYGTPTMAGSRPGALIAATWTALMAHGVDGYTDITKQIVETTRKIEQGIEKIPGLKLMAKADVSVVAWTSDVFDIYRLNGPLTDDKGWDLNFLQFPSGMHLCVTQAHTQPGVAEKFLKDLAEVSAACVATKEQKAEGAGAMYGAAQAVPDRSIIEDVVRCFCHNLYALPKPKSK